MRKVRPNFMIIGSAKCGTTSLSKILSLHPNCAMSRPKEPEFFNSDENYARGLSWYSDCWAHQQDEKVIGEATPRYTRRDLYPSVVDRIAEFDENLKFVHIARDPYEKLVSFWRMWARGKTLSMGKYDSFCDFYQNCENTSEVIRSCMYEYQLEPYLERFQPDQFHFMLTEDLRHNERETIEGLLKFLGLECEKMEPYLGVTANQAKPQSAGIVAQLRAFVRKIRGQKEVKPVFIAREELTPDLLGDFLSQVRSDAVAHLDRLNKPHSTWKLEP